jgi:hypothetical protein
VIHQHLSVTVCEDAKDATRQGFTYREPFYKSMAIKQVVVVQNGTESGKPAVDLILEDPATGQKYVAMVTGALLKSIPC